MTRDVRPQKLDASMFPTLPRYGTRVAQAPAAPRREPARRTAPAPRREPAADPQGAPDPGALCDMCGSPSARAKCGRCWGVVSGLASLKGERPEAYRAFVETLRQ